MRKIATLLCAGFLASCAPLDTEQSIRAKATEWLFVTDVFYILSDRICTAAALRLEAEPLRFSNTVRVRDVRSALPYLEKGKAVAFTVAGATPHQVSQHLTSLRLFEGLSLSGTFMGVARHCMNAPMSEAANDLLHSPEAWLIYDPTDYVLVLFDPHRQQGVFLRIKL